MRALPATCALLAALFAGAASAACGSEDPPAPQEDAGGDPRLGGDTTVLDKTKLAYAQRAANISGDRENLFDFGHSLFFRNWVTAPSTTDDLDGLGPVFNQRACSSCHERDGRSEPFTRSGDMLGMLLRLSVPGETAHGGPVGDPNYGGQLRPAGLLDIPGAGTPRVSYVEIPGTYGDGTAYSLQKPTYWIESLNYGPLSTEVMISPRVGPAVFGLGLLEAIPEEALLAHAHEPDADGVSGRPNYVWSDQNSRQEIGRFGWKANEPTVVQQALGAFLGDIGITSVLYQDETCTSVMTACNQRASVGEHPELHERHTLAIGLYMRTLGVPARRDVKDPTARKGEALFDTMGCASCHVTTFQTGAYPEVLEVENQTIHPFTDLLLHDLGEELADGRPDFQASGSEWRTPPLWGIGLLKTVNGHELLLHDARARGMAEAILWHGGEATTAKERFRNAPAADREALLTFLRSL